MASHSNNRWTCKRSRPWDAYSCSGSDDDCADPAPAGGLAEQEHATRERQCEGAEDLAEHLLLLYAQGRLDAKALCITAYHAKRAGIEWDVLAKYALAPGQSSDGHYAKHLRKVLPEQAGAPELQSNSPHLEP